MTTIVFDSLTKTLYADTQATDSIGTMISGTNFNNLKLFRTSDFIFGGAGDYHAVTSMMAHLIGWDLDQKIQEFPNLRGPENWYSSQCIVATNKLVALFECNLVTPFLPFRKRYGSWNCTNIWDYGDDAKATYLCIGSGEPAFREGMAKTNSVIESFAHTASIDPFTGGRLISTSLQYRPLIVDHGPIGWII